MNVADIADMVCDTVNRTDTESVVQCKLYIQRRYEMIYNAALWRDSLCVVSKTAAAGEIILPIAVAQPVKIRWSSETTLRVADNETLFDVDPAIFERTGSPMYFTRLRPVGTSAHPTDEPIRLVSSAADTSDVLIRGELDGVEQEETVTLTGVSNVASTKSWDVIHSLTKLATTGTITITGDTSGTALGVLWPSERERRYCRIKLHDIPEDVDESLLILGKATLRQMTNDLDTPQIRGIENSLLAFVEGDMLKRDRQYAKAQSMQAGGLAMLQSAIDLDRNQTAQVTRIIPECAPSYEDIYQ